MSLKNKKTIRGPYSHRVHSLVPVLDVRSHVKQEFGKQVNINTIINKMKAGQPLPAWQVQAQPKYGDFTNLGMSLTDAFNVVERAYDAFESLPLEFRREIDHDPRNLSTAPKSLYEKYGLLKKPVSSDAGTPAPAVPVGQGSGESVPDPVKPDKKTT